MEAKSVVDFDQFVDRFSSKGVSDEVHIMTKVVDHRDVKTTGAGVREYRVRWKGYGAKDDTWEP